MTGHVGYPLAIAFLIGLMSIEGQQTAIAQSSESPTPSPADVTPLRPSVPCPQDLETVVNGLLRDLPGYANRVAYRSLRINSGIPRFGTMLLAGRAEFNPLDISDRRFSENSETLPEAIQQVFFTTLERHYTQTDSVQLEHYHWLFLTEAEDGWRLALMFSRIAAAESTVRPPTPPRETSDGIVGQAVQLWLRDCRAGAVAPIESAEEATTER